MCRRISSLEIRAPPILRILETIRSEETVPVTSHHGARLARLRPILPKSTNYDSDEIKLFRNVHLIEEQVGIRSEAEALEILKQDPSHAIASKYMGWSLLQYSRHDINVVMDAISYLKISIASGNAPCVFSS